MQNPLILSPKMEVPFRVRTSHDLHSFLPRFNLVRTRVGLTRFSNGFTGCGNIHLGHFATQQRSGCIIKCSTTTEGTSDTITSKDDDDVVFVAGATGRVGSRTVRELLKLGFRVRAGVRSVQRAENLVQSVRQMKQSDGVPPIEKLEVVECDLEQPDSIIPALDSASVVICCIGASEKEVFDVTGPYRIDYLATKNLIEAATSAKVDHFILLTSLGTNKFGFPAAILNLFWGVLCWKRKAEEALFDSGLPYTIVRPGGMERPTDTFKETHNLTLSQEDTLFGGQVSNLQVAELMAFMAQNRDLSYRKVVEVVAETTAPLTPMGTLLEKIPSKRDVILKAKSKSPSGKEQKIATPVTTPSTSTTTPSSVSDIDADMPKLTVGVSPKMRPLSPYTAYEDLKPPSSPSPSPPSDSRKESRVSSEMVDGVPNIIDGILIEEVRKIFYHSPYPVYDDFKPPTSPTPSAPTSLTTLTISSDNEVKSVTMNGTGDLQKPVMEKPTPLSPYIVYDDLKPPTSPTPSAPRSSSISTAAPRVESEIATSSSNGNVKSITAEMIVDEQKPTKTTLSPLSPYTKYDDLKPPTSPTPSAPTSLSTSVTSAESESETGPTSRADKVQSITAEKTEERNTAVTNLRPQSPYTIYDDLKPPTSPTPSAPRSPSISTATPRLESEIATSSSNGDVKSITTEIIGDEQKPTKTTLSPLSPYTKYDDLKPPTSPTPSAPTSLSTSTASSAESVSETDPTSRTDEVRSITAEEAEERNTAVTNLRPQSPYTMYDDLKPPTSPTPTPKSL